MKRDIYLFEIEVGGSWIRVRAFNQKKKKIHESRIPSAHLPHSEWVPNLPRILAKVLKKFLPAEKLVIGAAGVWTKKEKKDLQRLLRPFAKRIIAISDVEFAYQKIFGNRPGILLIAGTGSIAYGRDASGKIARAGGLGPKKGDEGSGYWIGKEWSHKTNSFANKVREIAALAPAVIEKAKQGKKQAQNIVNRAWSELASLVVRVSKKLNFQKPSPLALYGGLFKNQFFRKGFIGKLNFSQAGKFRVENWQ